MKELRRKKGITLIALVVTIIVLIILAGVSINLILGDNGIVTKAKKGKEDYTKSKLKEELELKIAELETNEIIGNKEFSRKDLEKLTEIGAIIESTGIPAIGEYKDYDFTIDENNQVTIENKLTGERPTIIITKDTEEVVDVVTIRVVVTTTDGTINWVRLPDGTTTEETEFDYEVTSNGYYTFMTEGSNGRKGVAGIEITNTTLKEPVITSDFGYPILTSKGFILEGTASIQFDQREGAKYYYSVDGEKTWEEYQGPFKTVKSRWINARCVLGEQVLTETWEYVNQPQESIDPLAFDGDEETASWPVWHGGTKLFRVAEDAWGMRIGYLFKAKFWGGEVILNCMQEDGEIIERIGTYSAPISNMTWFDPHFEIPEGTYWIGLHYGGYQYSADIHEIRFVTD